MYTYAASIPKLAIWEVNKRSMHSSMRWGYLPYYLLWASATVIADFMQRKPVRL